MRKLILVVQTSFDGYVAGLNGEFNNFTNEPDNLDFVCSLTDEADAALFGRISYQLLNSDWPTAADKPNASQSIIKYSKWYNKVPKFVVSKTLHTIEVTNTIVIRENISPAINSLKQKTGKNILVFGSPTLIHSLIELDLLDDIWILIHPVLFGQGIPLFKSNLAVIKLKLLSSKQFLNGMIALHYAIENKSRLIKKFNDTIDIWLRELKRFNLNQLLQKPDEKSWSLGQLYMHIINETNWYNRQIDISLSQTQNSNIPLSFEAENLFRAGSFANKKHQGDPLITENVKQPVSIEQLNNDFEKLKIDTNSVWNKMLNQTSYGKSEHPGMGYLNCYEWLQYSEMHMRHHLKQKARIADNLKL